MKMVHTEKLKPADVERLKRAYSALAAIGSTGGGTMYAYPEAVEVARETAEAAILGILEEVEA